MNKHRLRHTTIGVLSAALALAACTPAVSEPTSAPSPTDTATAQATVTTAPQPTSAPTATTLAQPASPRLAVLGQDNTTVSFVEVSPPLDADTFVGGLLPRGGAAGGTVYYLDFTTQAGAIAAEAGGRHTLDFIPKPNYGLGVWPGNASQGPRLGWGIQPSGDPTITELFTSAVDGTNVTSILREAVIAQSPAQLVFNRWSDDGGSFYFSREPLGIGGYILLAGASSLYRYNLSDQSVTDLIPFNPTEGRFLCLDDLSADARLVADHCAGDGIAVRDLASGQATTIQPPVGVADYHVLGSARFNAEASRVAFALAKGNPDSEQGWVAVSDSLGGPARLIATSPPGDYYTVIGWLNAGTLLLQTNSLTAQSGPAVWTVNVADGESTRLAEGTFLALMP